MKRKDLIQYIKIAGYHDDNKLATRLYCENSISRQAFNDAFLAGRTAKLNGVKCTCKDCNQ